MAQQTEFINIFPLCWRILKELISIKSSSLFCHDAKISVTKKDYTKVKLLFSDMTYVYLLKYYTHKESE